VRRRYVVGVAVVLSLAVVGALIGTWLVDRLIDPDSADGTSATVEQAVPDDTAPADERPAADHGPRPAAVPDDAEAAIVDRIVDGDTVRVIAAPGGSIPEGGSIRVRLLNIDTPELARDGDPAECGAEAATARLEELIAPGDLVWLAADREDRDVYDRPLRGLWASDGVFVNELLAEEGYAEVLLIEPNDRFHLRIATAVERAQREGRGIWGELCPR